MRANLPDPSLLHKFFVADFDTGLLWWARRDASFFPDSTSAKKWNTRWAGKPAFTSVTNWGYVQGSLLNIKFSGHHIIWAMYHGAWPQHQIDHVNGVRNDNRICNLQDAPQSVNMRNRALDGKNTSGICGVRWEKSRDAWQAYGTTNKVMKNLGRFKCFAHAVTARKSFNDEHNFSHRHGVKSPPPERPSSG